MAMTPPEATAEDRHAARLLATLAQVDKAEAIKTMTPIITAARLWAEQETEKNAS